MKSTKKNKEIHNPNMVNKKKVLKSLRIERMRASNKGNNRIE